jgi:glycosyltransferase involved in cell wall biosynthesis
MKVLVRIPLSPFSGYGRDGLGLVRSLIRWGADVYLDPTAVQAPLPVDVASLLTKPLQAPFDLAIIHVDPAQLEATEPMTRSADVVIGWTMWEYSNLHNLRGHSKLKKKWERFDALVAYDEVSAGAMREYYKGPLITVQGGFWPEDWPQVERDWYTDEFYFCMVGNLNARKGPFLAVQAFKELKEEHEDFDKNARLSLKTMAPGLHSAMEQVYPGLRIFYDSWPDDLLRKFYAQQHVLLAPSRGEGKNMPALEFQSTGGTVIATNWGGHKNWLNSAINYPLDYELESLSVTQRDTLWAAPSVPHLKELMLHTFRNRNEAKRKGELAAQIIPGLSSWDRVVERLFLQVSQILPEKGERLWMLASMDRKTARRADS